MFLLCISDDIYQTACCIHVNAFGRKTIFIAEDNDFVSLTQSGHTKFDANLHRVCVKNSQPKKANYKSSFFSVFLSLTFCLVFNLNKDIHFVSSCIT